MVLMARFFSRAPIRDKYDHDITKCKMNPGPSTRKQGQSKHSKWQGGGQAGTLRHRSMPQRLAAACLKFSPKRARGAEPASMQVTTSVTTPPEQTSKTIGYDGPSKQEHTFETSMTTSSRNVR